LQQRKLPGSSVKGTMEFRDLKLGLIAVGEHTKSLIQEFSRFYENIG
jgi:hypothetical protein